MILLGLEGLRTQPGWRGSTVPQGGGGGWVGATEESDWVEGLRDPSGRGGAKGSTWAWRGLGIHPCWLYIIKSWSDGVEGGGGI